jgi:protein SCO1
MRRKPAASRFPLVAPGAALAALAALALLLTAPEALARTMGHTKDEGGEQAYRVTSARYDVPAVALTDQDGRSIQLAEVLGGPEPVAMNFFFASCRTICPVMSSAFSGMIEKLGPEAKSMRVVSISIDPEEDTPDVLRSYARRFSAGPEWTFLTGTQGQIDLVLKAFLADSGGKFNHQPLFFFRSPSGREWLRVDGLPGASELASIARKVERSPQAPD